MRGTSVIEPWSIFYAEALNFTVSNVLYNSKSHVRFFLNFVHVKLSLSLDNVYLGIFFIVWLMNFIVSYTTVS